MKGGNSGISLAAINSQIAALQNEVFTQVHINYTSAQIKLFQTNPLQVLPSPGIGNTYIFDNFLWKLNFNTTAYTTNLNLALYFTSVANLNITTNASILGAASTIAGMSAKTPFGGTANQYSSNATVIITVNNAGNPLAGDGTLDLYFGYRIIAF